MSYTSVTYFFLLICLLGAQVFSINVGVFQISPYRLLLAISPILMFEMFVTAIFKKNILVKYEYPKFFGVWFLYSIFSGVWAFEHISWGRSLLFLTGGFFSTLFIFAFIDNRKKLKSALKIVVLASVASGVLALYEISTGNYFYLSEENRAYYKIGSQATSLIGLRVPVTIFGNPNDYSLFIYISSIFCFLLQRISVSRIAYFFYVSIFAFFVFLLFSTMSRAGILGLICFFFLYFLVKFYTTSFFNRITFLCFGFVLIAASCFYFGDFFLILGDLIAVDLSGSDFGSDLVRINLILNGLIFLLQSYFFGIGIGQIEHYIATKSIYFTAHITNMHNWWFEILVSSGILVFLIYVLVYFRTAIKAFNQAVKATDYETRVTNTAVFCFLISFVVASVGPSSLLQNEWIWPLLALMMKAPFIQTRRDNFSQGKTY